MLILKVKQCLCHQHAASGLTGAQCSPWVDFLISTREWASQIGAVGYLRKLFGRGVLLEAIGRTIGEDSPG